MSRGNHSPNSASALDFGILGLAVFIAALPFVLAWMAWRAATNADY